MVQYLLCWATFSAHGHTEEAGRRYPKRYEPGTFISGPYGPERRIGSMGQSDQWELSVPESPTVETDKEQTGG